MSGDTTQFFRKGEKESKGGVATAPSAPRRDEELTVFEALTFREALNETATDMDLLWGALANVSFDGGEKNPEWQRHKIVLRELISRLASEQGMWLDPQEAETLYQRLVD